MHIQLAYGKTGLQVEFPDNWNIQVVEPLFAPGLPDPVDAVRKALRIPIGMPSIRNVVGNGPVGIIFNDITRPTPNPLLLKAILAELPDVEQTNITLFVALGSHRQMTTGELCTMFGNDVADSFRIVQNNAFDCSTQVFVGTTTHGNEVWINRMLIECPIRIMTGFIEPHFFAGFSGGGKAIMPGMAGQSTILRNHRAENIAHPKATGGFTSGNPIWEEIHETARMVEERSNGKNFLINVALNRNKEITAIFAGDLDAAHKAGVEFVRKKAMVRVNQAFDIVVTTNSGYPLDLNLYQAVKGMSAAARVVRQGGAIVVAADCWDGIPEHGLYGDLLRASGTPQKLLESLNTPGFLKQDQWQAQIQAQIQLKADVYVYSSHLSEKQIRSAMLLPAPSIESVMYDLVDKYGPAASICILPEGPQTVPYI